MNLREASKQTYNAAHPPDLATINAGSLQRIADATELMAQNHATLIRERDLYQRQADEFAARIEDLLRTQAAHKAWITRLKKQLGSPFKTVVE